MIFRSFTIIELLISIILSLFILFGFSSFLSETQQHKFIQQEQLFLQQEAHRLINYFQQHIRNIGYLGRERENTNADLFMIKEKSYFLSQDKQCLIFVYDLNGDGCIGEKKGKNACRLGENSNVRDINKEIFGFKVKNKEIYLYTPANKTFNTCMAEQCPTVLDGCNGKWSVLGSGNYSYQTDILKFHWIKENSLLHIELRLKANRSEQYYTVNAYVPILNALP